MIQKFDTERMVSEILLRAIYRVFERERKNENRSHTRLKQAGRRRVVNQNRARQITRRVRQILRVRAVRRQNTARGVGAKPIRAVVASMR